MNRSTTGTLLVALALAVAWAGCTSTDDGGAGKLEPGDRADGAPDGARPNEVGPRGPRDDAEIDTPARPDITLEDTFVAVCNRKSGLIQIAFANKDNSKYLRIKRGSDGKAVSRRIDSEKVAISRDGNFTEKVFPNSWMKQMVDDLTGNGYFGQAEVLDGQSLDSGTDFAMAPGVKYGILVERSGRLWGLPYARPGSSKALNDAYLISKHRLIEYTMLESLMFTQESAERAFPPVPPSRTR